MLKTRNDASKSLFIFTKDKNTNEVHRVAVTGDMQVGLKSKPAALELHGRLALSEVRFVTASNVGTFDAKNENTIVSVDGVTAPASRQINVYLPSNPRTGQLHVVKDASGTAATTNIVVSSKVGSRIDGDPSVVLVADRACVTVYWAGDEWKKLSEINESSSAPTPTPTVTPVFTLTAVAGNQSTSTGTSLSKYTVGATYFDPEIVGSFPGSRTYYFRSIIRTSTGSVASHVDLYDVDGIVTGTPGTVVGSGLSTTQQLSTLVEVNLSSVLSNITDPGVLEVRLWKGSSDTATVTCLAASIDIEFS